MNKYGYTILSLVLLLAQCNEQPKQNDMVSVKPKKEKTVVYQVFTRLFGNTNTTNKKWGTIEENGVGKFEDFTETALQEIKDLGVTHIWYTGVPHHATATDYSQFGISNDDPDVIKGRAGSPYAVKDYYNVNPDLAIEPNNRLNEFKELVARTHKVGLKLLIDIVPNHVARNYEGAGTPDGIDVMGKNDDTSVNYTRDNNFYYIPGESFEVPEWKDGYLPLGGDSHPLSDSKFAEIPAKWTGNGSRLAQPDINDWYETVKINYGVRPDGSFDFDRLPEEYSTNSFKEHYEFWQGRSVPDSWTKIRDIVSFWLDLGVDGFRYDMAEMVPVEFWSFLNSHIKMTNSEAFLLAEVYNPELYRDYIHKGKMDYLYDKVELYDSLKHIMQGDGSTDHLVAVQNGMMDIEHHMLHFLENHDEQRIASPEFAGDAEIGKPAMVVSALLSTSPTMIYFGQEVGEPGGEDAGFGKPSRTSIFDYIGVPHHQRWMNEKEFDGEQLSESEKELREFYKKLLNISVNEEAFTGAYKEIHSYNREHAEGYDHRLFSFVRWTENQHIIVVSNFDKERSYDLDLTLPSELIEEWN
ncbi:MAG: alpha-amylase family protein, partial [Bacteroidia bacterium]|nr:alpha-amylase family protein [Bacteroidia bacterium]